MLACLLAGSVNAQEILAENSDTVDTQKPNIAPPILDKKILHLYKEINGDRWALQVEVNKKTGNYDLFKHYLTEKDDRYLDTLDVIIKYLPALVLEYPGGVKPRNKQESESMRATSFSCSTIPINWEQGQWSTYATGNNVFIQYNMDENNSNIRGTIYGNAAICQESSWSGILPPPKRHWFELNFRTHDYKGQASHVPIMARYKWAYPHHHGIGMYFGNSGYSCTNGQSPAHNTRIEAWWPAGPQGPGGATGYSYNNTCGKNLQDDVAYKLYMDGSTNSNNSLQTVRYKINKWEWNGTNWIDTPHTSYVSYQDGPMQNFDENATGVFIVATLPSEIVQNHRDWTVEIQSLNTWWTN